MYEERGFHIEPLLLPIEYCDKLLGRALSRPNATDGTFRPIPMPHREHADFLAAVRFLPIVRIVEALVGGKASAIGGEFFYMPPGSPGFSNHQDNYYVCAPPDAFVSAWIALCDAGPENGGLAFCPGTHKLSSLPVREGSILTAVGQNPAAQAIECVVPDGTPRIDVRLEKGSVVFFHGLLVHSSYTNDSDRFRYSLLTTYIRAGVPFRPGRTQQRSEIDLYAN